MRESFDVAAEQPPMHRHPLALENSPVAQIDNVLTRAAQKLGGRAGRQEVTSLTLVHDRSIARKHNKRNGVLLINRRDA